MIAAAALPGSTWLDFFWPIVGVGAVVGALLATRLRVDGDLRRLLAVAYLVQALGIAMTLVAPSVAGYIVGSLLFGLPFTSITFFAMQEVRLVRPARAASTMGLLTALYGVGQIAGPPLVSVLLRRSPSRGAGFTSALEVATAALVVGALLCLWMSRAFPKPPR